MGHCCGTLLWDTLGGTQLRDTLVGHSYGPLFDALVGYSCGTLLRATLVGHSCGDSLRTRLPPKVTHQVSKHMSSLQNERFVRDFLQKSRVKSPKQAFRTRLSPKLTCQSLQNEHVVRDFLQKSSGNTHRSTHITQPAKQFRESSPSKQHPFTRHHLYHNSRPHNSLRLPRIFPHPTRTKYCACHEMSPPSHLATSPFPAPATRTATHTKYCAYHLMSASTKFAPHHTFGMISTRSDPPKSPF